MTITQTALTGGINTTDADSFTTGSHTPSANKLILATITTRGVSGDPPVPTVTGNGLTWVNIVDQVSAATAGRKLFIFRAMGGSPTSGVTTIDYGGGNTQRNNAWQIDEFDGVDTSGSNGSGAVVQVASSNGGSDAQSISVTLASFADATNNAPYIGVFHGSNEVTTQEGGYTELGDRQTGEDNTLGCAFKLGEDTTPSESWATSSPRAGGALEIKAATTGFDHSQAILIG